MIKRRGEARLCPCECCVAGIASLFELPFVWVAMTVSAIGEWQACIAGLAVGSGCVTAPAKDISMFAGQRITRLRVIETLLIDAGGLPVHR